MIFRFINKYFPIFLLFLSCFQFQCIATSNSYTARTLDKKQFAMSPSIDNIVTCNSEKIKHELEPTFTPSLGIHYGLTNRFELGLRGIYPYTLEGILRYQVLPHTNRICDISANLHYGCFKLRYLPYLKYGLLIGKNIRGFEPFLGFYQYDYLDTEYSFRVINCGIGLPWKDDLIIPEFNWQFYKDDISYGFGFISIGFRIK